MQEIEVGLIKAKKFPENEYEHSLGNPKENRQIGIDFKSKWAIAKKY